MSARSTSRDTYGWKRGLGAYSKDDRAFGDPKHQHDSFKVQNEKVNYLIDDDPSLPNSKELPGGGALSKKNGIGAGPPRYRPKSGPIGNLAKPK